MISKKKTLFPLFSIMVLVVLFGLALAACGPTPAQNSGSTSTNTDTAANTSVAAPTQQATSVPSAVATQIVPTSTLPPPTKQPAANASAVGSGAAPVSSGPVNCGTISTPSSTPASAAQQSESCFWQAYQRCSTASLVYHLTVLSSTSTHTFTTVKQNGGCAVADSMSMASNTSSTVCSTMSYSNLVLRIERCGNGSNILISIQ